MNKKDELDYYDVRGLLSKNRTFNFVLSERNIGKTYSLKKFLIKEFIKKGHTFIWFIRFKNKLKKQKNKFFAKVGKDPDLQGIKLEQKGLKLYINDKYAGEIDAISDDTSFKGVDNDGMYKYMIYDEFLQEKTGAKLPYEGERMMSIALSLAREREDFRIIAMANTVKIINPIFEEFNILPNPSKEYNLYQDIAVEFPPKGKYKTAQPPESPLMRAISKTNYGRYALDGEFKDNNNDLIVKLDRFSECKYVLKNELKTYGVWYNRITMAYTISKKIDPNTKRIYSVTLDDLDKEGAYKGWGDSMMVIELIKARNRNNLYFSDIATRENAKDFLKRIGIY